MGTSPQPLHTADVPECVRSVLGSVLDHGLHWMAMSELPAMETQLEISKALVIGPNQHRAYE